MIGENKEQCHAKSERYHLTAAAASERGHIVTQYLRGVGVGHLPIQGIDISSPRIYLLTEKLLTC